jgi:hypothetical protein
MALGRSLFFGSGDCPNAPRDCTRPKDVDRSDLLDLFSTLSRHLFRADDGMATAVLGGALLLASMIFLEPGKARSLTGSGSSPCAST